MFSILKTSLTDKPLILQGEVWLRSLLITFDAPGWLDKDPYGIHTFLLSIIVILIISCIANRT